MKKGLISVIVPCYNLEGYLPKCMDSILKQTYTNLEIIAVDDGSTDGTPDILAQYAKKDRRVVFVRQENTGGIGALNAGLGLASGEFIAFVDNDDWVELNMYEKLHLALVDGDADVAICNFNMVHDERTDFCFSGIKDEVVDISADPYGYFLKYCACEKPNNYLWSRLYKAEIIKKAGIEIERFWLSSDVVFNHKLLPYYRRVAFVGDGLYNYVQRADSHIHNVAKTRDIVRTYADSFDSLLDYYENNGFEDFLRVMPIHALTRLRSAFFYSRLSGVSDEDIVEHVCKGFMGRRIFDYLTGAVK